MRDSFEVYTRAAELLKVLAHPVRLCILRGLLEKGECNVGHMQACLGAPQSTISQHLQKLRAAGIVEARRDGLEMHYRVSHEKAAALLDILMDKID